MEKDMSRVETGIVMFKYKDEEIDWPGVFIRNPYSSLRIIQY
jgi:hypothetical protein